MERGDRCPRRRSCSSLCPSSASLSLLFFALCGSRYHPTPNPATSTPKSETRNRRAFCCFRPEAWDALLACAHISYQRTGRKPTNRNARAMTGQRERGASLGLAVFLEFVERGLCIVEFMTAVGTCGTEHPSLTVHLPSCWQHWRPSRQL
jgi:hypothetical protein